MNEDEIPEDIEGWVVSVITWVHMLGRVLPHVQKLEVGMRGFQSAKHILKDIGFGDTFVAQLVLRTLQEIGFACGSPILMMGTGAIHMSNRVCNATLDSKQHQRSTGARVVCCIPTRQGKDSH